MSTVKKLILAPFFLLVLTLLIYQLNPLFKSYDFIFALSADTLFQLATLTGLILATSFLFVLFATFAGGWKIVLPVTLAGALIPVVLIDPALGLILSVGILVSLLITYLGLENSLKNYLTFNPNSLFGSPIRHLSTLLILVISLTYFLSISQVIRQKSFEIPDSLIDSAIKLTPLPESASQPQQTSQPQLSREQIDLLKQNPGLLKQSGLDPKILDTLAPQKGNQVTKSPQDLLTETLKQTIKDQLQTVIKPYLGIIPAILAVMLFLILLSITSIFNLLIYPLLWIVFYILEKTGFIRFTTEQRPVKKMVV